MVAVMSDDDPRQRVSGTLAHFPGVPASVSQSPPLSPHLARLADRARTYVEAASSLNTRRAYAADWRQSTGWCRRQGLEVVPPSPQIIGLYITACASGAATSDRKRKRYRPQLLTYIHALEIDPPVDRPPIDWKL